ncbi:hypothetical protein AAFF_G00049490 [Aldrovandia affinis]|uniref:Uncharacterized protein n=1 Tax=Aldrovandia affinis TaxID=143900 RepID=A0AAD7S1B1_9TELE|nr:hypothetical protein AAFF_G00049490 [Aldrovandia affinis]
MYTVSWHPPAADSAGRSDDAIGSTARARREPSVASVINLGRFWILDDLTVARGTARALPGSANHRPEGLRAYPRSWSQGLPRVSLGGAGWAVAFLFH